MIKPVENKVFDELTSELAVMNTWVGRMLDSPIFSVNLFTQFRPNVYYMDRKDGAWEMTLEILANLPFGESSIIYLDHIYYRNEVDTDTHSEILKQRYDRAIIFAGLVKMYRDIKKYSHASEKTS